ncbi:MAG: phosphoribosylformylglycinamidine synthase subunit PurL, partial [Acidobacteriia bacterium]|nr:phosphoribosylformylglycinamidine synthase subunit PurL [Terriglobia bacterium]
VITLGDGIAIAFKIESHNHPRLAEPFQGAATGVGGILRDMFTMGARPIAAMNSLRFGSLHPRNRAPSSGPGKAHFQPANSPNDVASETPARNRRILRGVVGGIAFYGNCFGVPTLGGEIYFEDCYAQNPLVNAFALGIFKKDPKTQKPKIFLGRASGIGNSVIYVGAKTGRDGIHGASLLASSEFDETTASKRPNVQVGDPFLEKCLLEACLEAMESGGVLGIQDMGAAGLTCSTCEMAARGDTGIEIDLKFVPQRETGMTPYEIMLSESQERMLLVAKRGRVEELQGIFSKWGLEAVKIGVVTRNGLLRVRDHGKLVAEIPAKALANDAPVYRRPKKAPEKISGKKRRTPAVDEVRFQTLSGSMSWSDPSRLETVLRRLMSSENLCSRRWVYQQYDHMVRTNTCVLPGSDAAVIRIKNTTRGIALSLDGNGRYARIDPREGAKLAVAESCRNLVSVGARPLAATNCLNFGNPEKPEVMWAFSEVIDGIKEACEAFGTPITGGNVSFYNETFGSGIFPTPVIGMVGVVEDVAQLVPMGFQQSGDLIALLGDVTQQPAPDFLESASEFLKVEMGKLGTKVSAVDLKVEHRLHRALLDLHAHKLLRSCHDLSEGGLAIALAESSFASRQRILGCEIKLPVVSGRGFYSLLFNEKPSRVVVSFSRENLPSLSEVCEQHKIPFQVLGRVIQEDWLMRTEKQVLIQTTVKALFDPWDRELERLLSTVR